MVYHGPKCFYQAPPLESVLFRYVENGHVSSYLFHQDVFRQAIYDSFATYGKKYQQSPIDGTKA